MTPKKDDPQTISVNTEWNNKTEVENITNNVVKNWENVSESFKSTLEKVKERGSRWNFEPTRLLEATEDVELKGSKNSEWSQNTKSWGESNVDNLKSENTKLSQNSEVELHSKNESKNHYVILSKWQLYSFLRKWYFSSFPCDKNDLIQEKFIVDNLLYVFNENNLPVVQGSVKEATQFDVIVQIELDEKSEYIVKNNGTIIWLKWFFPITIIKTINLIDDNENNIFKNPVPNDNNNFIIPKDLCITNVELYGKCKNEFKPVESQKDSNDSEIVEKMEKYNRLLWAYFFSNFWVYANDINENYSSWFLSLLNETYSKNTISITEELNETKDNPLKIMRNLAYQWEFSKLQSPEELIKLLLEKNIINLSDSNYINKQYESVSWFKNLEEFFNYKKDTPDNAVWQIITYLIKFCNNKSLESRSREISQFVMQMFDQLKPDIETLFTLWLCCWFNDIVCENRNSWRKELKDIYLSLRERLVNDLYEFILTWEIRKDDKLVIKSEDKPIRENEESCVFKKEKYIIEWEEIWVIAEKKTYKLHYLDIIKARYWKDFEKITKKTYMFKLFELRVPELDSYNNITIVVNSIINNTSGRDEELEGVMKLDRDYTFKK